MYVSLQENVGENFQKTVDIKIHCDIKPIVLDIEDFQESLGIIIYCKRNTVILVLSV